MLTLTPYVRHNHLTTFDPFRELEEMERSFFGADTLAAFRTDIEDEGDHLLLSADLPGFRKEDIHIDLDDDRLEIHAERHSNYEKKDGKFLRCERSYGNYSRSFNLDGIDAEGITAAYDNGVLKLTLPKLTPAKKETKRLEIQ